MQSSASYRSGSQVPCLNHSANPEKLTPDRRKESSSGDRPTHPLMGSTTEQQGDDLSIGGVYPPLLL
ncbi:MAG: hypothetical protein AAGG51_15475 [Cyanobacteria bacterium P01_G01_bin.54]